MRIRSLVTASLVGAAMALAACAGGSPLEPSSGEYQPYSDMPGSASLTLGSSGKKLAVCTPLPAATRTATIGIMGGSINVGPHSLWIPPGALLSSKTITAEIVANDSTNSVKFAPEGLKFFVPGLISLSYDNCNKKSLFAQAQVAYTTNDLLQILELLPSFDNPVKHTTIGTIRHFSRYAIAY